MRKLFGQFTRFGLVGAIGLVVDIGDTVTTVDVVYRPEAIPEGEK